MNLTNDEIKKLSKIIDAGVQSKIAAKDMADSVKEQIAEFTDNTDLSKSAINKAIRVATKAEQDSTSGDSTIDEAQAELDTVTEILTVVGRT